MQAASSMEQDMLCSIMNLLNTQMGLTWNFSALLLLTIHYELTTWKRDLLGVLETLSYVPKQGQCNGQKKKASK